MRINSNLTKLLAAFVLSLGLMSCGISSSGSGVGTTGVSQTLLLTDANGNPLSNMFWSINNGSGSDFTAFTVGSGSFLGLEDDDGDTCSDPEETTPQTANGTAGADGCSDSSGRIEFSCTGDYTLYVDDGNGNVSEKDMTCAEDEDETPDEVPFDDIVVEEPLDYTHLVIYVAGSSTGLLGDRTTTDARCADWSPNGADETKAHAFLSYSDEDTLADMPTHFDFSAEVPIQSIYETEFADNWEDLLDGSISTSFYNAEMVDGRYWTGSNADGTYSGNSCNGWTSEAGGSALATSITYYGTVGHPEESDGLYLNDGTWDCSNARYVLCVAPANEVVDVK